MSFVTKRQMSQKVLKSANNYDGYYFNLNIDV